jgi:acetyltransferase-like isoleucine patch superfamily enzyme
MKTTRILTHYLGNLVRYLQLTKLRMAGVVIGENTMISMGAKIDTHRGKVIIGNNCLITAGVFILSHDGASRMIDMDDLGNGEVVIGNNVFIGVNSVILKNVKIGDNSVIGAGSVINKDVPPCSLVVGNPGRIIKTLEGPFPVLNDHKTH